MPDLNNGGFLAHRNFVENEDETGSDSTSGLERTGCEGHSPGHPEAILSRRKNQDRAGWPEGRIQHVELCRRESIAESLYYAWSKEFLEAGKRRLAGDTERSASTGEVNELRREVRDMKELVADRLLDFGRARQNPFYYLTVIFFN